MPESLHADLAQASERAGMSLNAFINDALAATLGRRRDAPAAPASRPRRRFVERLLVVNLIVLSVVGVLAVALLVQALR